jgi:zinc protease
MSRGSLERAARVAPGSVTLAIFATLVAALASACGGDRTVYSPPGPRPARGYPAVASSAAPLARDEAPAPETTAFVAPQPTEVTLPNGLRLIVLERHTMPFATIHVNVVGGEDDGAPGLARLTGFMLFEGTTTRDPILVHQGFGERGADYDVSMTNLTTVLEMRTPSPNIAGVIERASDVARNPIFSDEPLSHYDMTSPLHRTRAHVTTLLADANRESLVVADVALNKLMDPTSPSVEDLSHGFETLPRGDLVRFHAAHFAPQRTIVVVVGDVKTAEVVQHVTKTFGDWRASPSPLEATHPVAIKTAMQVVLVDKPGTAQAAVAVGAWVPRDVLGEDYRAVSAFRYWLGGSFTSRLFRAIRESSGATYGVHSFIRLHRAHAELRIQGKVETDGAAEAVESIIKETTRFATEPPSEREMREAHTRSSIADFATNEGAADELSVIALTPEEPLDHFMKRRLVFDVPPPETLMRVAKAYLGRERLQIAIVGDAKKLKPELERRGIGPIVVR